MSSVKDKTNNDIKGGMNSDTDSESGSGSGSGSESESSSDENDSVIGGVLNGGNESDIDDEDEDEDDSDNEEGGGEMMEGGGETKKQKKTKKQKNIEVDNENIIDENDEIFNNDGDDEEDDDDDEDNENYLQRFDDNLRKNIIADYHPEMQQHNYEEVDALSRVIKNENGIIIDPLHKTLPFLTKYEKARILGERAKQLNSGAKPFIEIENNIIDGYLIALKELEQKKMPFIIKRPLPNGGSEYWRLKDLEILI